MNFRLVTILFIVLLSLGVRADFNDGVVALTMGNYDKAMSMFVPLAETTDHAYAQYFVGRMYAAGQGVEKNLETRQNKASATPNTALGSFTKTATVCPGTWNTPTAGTPLPRTSATPRRLPR